MKYIKAFWLGVTEFRSNTTTHYEGALIEIYDAGRELAHVLTLRRYES